MAYHATRSNKIIQKKMWLATRTNTTLCALVLPLVLQGMSTNAHRRHETSALALKFFRKCARSFDETAFLSIHKHRRVYCAAPELCVCRIQQRAAKATHAHIVAAICWYECFGSWQHWDCWPCLQAKMVAGLIFCWPKWSCPRSKNHTTFWCFALRISDSEVRSKDV